MHVPQHSQCAIKFSDDVGHVAHGDPGDDEVAGVFDVNV